MSKETVLTDEQITAINMSMNKIHMYTDFARAIEAAVLESEEVRALRNMLYEARCQLPLAAQFWNEDDKKDRSDRNVQHVLGLIKRIDAALESNHDH